ncbi:MAG: hypothetical protein EOL88_02970 [Bacteroidia bacterium]|nr:hypothetical protein [Bacteroidia bacterium]
MKRLLITLLMCSALIPAIAQQNIATNHFTAGLNGAFYGSGDIIGPALYIAYTRQFSPYLGIAPRLQTGYANSLTNYAFDHASSLMAFADIEITPLPNRLNRFSLLLGGVYHHFIKVYGNYQRISEYEEYLSNNATYRNDKCFGLHGALKYRIVNTEKYQVGIIAELMTGFYEGYLEAESLQCGLFFTINH